MAKGLEVFRKAFYGEGLPFQDCLAKAANTIIKMWGDYVPPDIGSAKQKDLAACLIAIESFFTEYPPAEDPITPLIVNGEPAIEFNFALPLPGVLHPVTGEPILYAGKFDMLARYQDTIYVNDEKTTTQLGASWGNQFKNSSQMTGYVWASKQFGHNVQGVIIRGIGILKKRIDHALVIEQRPQWMIDRWLAQITRDVERLKVSWTEGIYDFAIDDACSNYGGCPYLTLCTSEHPERYIDVDYEVSEWDPLAKEDF